MRAGRAGICGGAVKGSLAVPKGPRRDGIGGAVKAGGAGPPPGSGSSGGGPGAGARRDGGRPGGSRAEGGRR